VLRALRGEFTPERLQDGAVEAPARLEVGDAQVNVVDQPALVELHGLSSSGFDDPRHVITGLAPVISMKKSAALHIIGMAGTSPATTV
jgi:hypothetical protein